MASDHPDKGAAMSDGASLSMHRLIFASIVCLVVFLNPLDSVIRDIGAYAAEYGFLESALDIYFIFGPAAFEIARLLMLVARIAALCFLLYTIVCEGRRLYSKASRH